MRVNSSGTMADQSPSDTGGSNVEAAQEEQEVRFPPEEETELLSESNRRKTKANSLYAQGDYHEALDVYAKATDVCPNYLDYELALLQTNIAACHLKLREWKNAITAATTSLDKLDKLDASNASDVKAIKHDNNVNPDADPTSSSMPLQLQEGPERPVHPHSPGQQSDSKRIRYKALMRRARARSELGGWQNLDGALADYTALQTMDNLTRDDRKLVAAQLAALPVRIKEAKEKEVAQMWDQLKKLGNGILKPFGLSTENFQMQQDPKTGGYSMNMRSG